MNKPLLIVLALAASPALADVYKCKDAKGATVYQASPCEQANLQQTGTVKKPLVSTEEERARMAAIAEKNKDQSNAYRDIRYKADKAEKAEREAEAEREIKERAVVAEERKARAEERKARAAEIEAMRGGR